MQASPTDEFSEGLLLGELDPCQYAQDVHQVGATFGRRQDDRAPILNYSEGIDAVTAQTDRLALFDEMVREACCRNDGHLAGDDGTRLCVLTPAQVEKDL